MTSYMHEYLPTPATVRAAKSAKECQDAVNLRAVLASMLRDIDAINAEHRDATHGKCLGIGGDLINNHPVVIVYLDKFCALSRIQPFGEASRVMAAHAAVDELLKFKSAEFEVIPIP